MPAETLRKIKTMREVKTSHDTARNRRVKTTNSLSRPPEETARLMSLADRRTGQILAKEMRRFAAMEASAEKSRGRVLKAREKLAATVNRNHALTELRYELQKARWEKIPLPTEPPARRVNPHRIEIDY